MSQFYGIHLLVLIVFGKDLEFSIYSIMSSTDSDSFTSSLQFGCFCFFSLPDCYC